MSLFKPGLAPVTLLLPVLVTPLSMAIASELNPMASESGVDTFDAVVVVATRTAQPIENVAASVAAVNSDELNKQMAEGIEDALRYIPGVNMNSNARFGSADFNVRGMEGSRVKVLIDGVEQPIAYSSGVSGTSMNVLGKGQGQVEIDTLTAIEINKGASSSLYGSGALGGSVLMRTKSSDDLLQGEQSHLSVNTGYLSQDTSYKTTINAAREWNDHLKAMMIFTHREGHELETFSDSVDVLGIQRSKADPLRYSSDNLLTKLEITPNGAHQVIITGQYYEEETNGDSLSLEGSSYDSTTRYTNYRFDDTQRRARVGIEHEWQIETGLFDSINWQAFWQMSEAKNQTHDTLVSTNSAIADLDRTRFRDAKDSSLQLDVQFGKSGLFAGTEHELIYGVTLIDSQFELGTRDKDSSGKDTSGVVEMPPKTDVRKVGLFAQDQLYLMNDALIVSTGLRFDRFEYRPHADSRDIVGNTGNYADLDKEALTGQLGGVYHFTEMTSAFARYSRGFKAPSPDELYYSFERVMGPMRVVVEANPDLKPETSDSFELGVRQYGTGYQWELAGYYNDYQDFINSVSWTEFGPTGMTMYQRNDNIDNARIYGVEFAGSVQLGDVTSLPQGSYLRLSAAWSEGENTDTDEAINSIAPAQGVLGVGFNSANGFYGWETTITAAAGKSGDEWSDPDNIKAPGYTVVDVTAYVQPMKDLTIRGGVFNLFDKKYWTYNRLHGISEETESNYDILTSPGINFGVNLDYVF